ncbi:MAG: PolC-type DNA polymerase III [Candidatus Wallbacteria bacterium]
MSSSYGKTTKLVIAPKAKEKFFQHIKNCTALSSECRSKVLQGEIEHIEFLPENKELNITFKLKTITSIIELIPLEKYFMQVFPYLNVVNFDLAFSEKASLAVIVDKLWYDVAQYVIKKAPSCQVWMPMTRVSLFNETSIRLEIGDETGFYSLKDRSADKHIENYIRDKFNVFCRVFIDRANYKTEKIGGFDYKDPVDSVIESKEQNIKIPGEKIAELQGNFSSPASLSVSAGKPVSAKEFEKELSSSKLPPVQQQLQADLDAANAAISALNTANNSKNNANASVSTENKPAAPKTNNNYSKGQYESKPKENLAGVNENVYYGKVIADKYKPQKISSIIEEARNILIEGIVVEIEARLLKNGKKLTSFSVSDETDTFVCKLFSEPDVELKIKPGAAVKVIGNVKFDTFAKENVLMVNDVNKTKLPERQDKAEEKRVELHAHSKMSALDGLAEIKDYVKTAARWGHKAVALTDHGVVQGFPEFVEAAKDCKIKPIFGMEGYLMDDSVAETMKSGFKVKLPPPYHIIILAATQEGIKNLYRLVSLSHIDYYYKRPRIPRAKLLELREGLILGSACEAGELIKGIINDKTEEEIEKIAKFYDYLEVQPAKNNSFFLDKMPEKFKSRDDLIALNKRIYELGKKLNIPVCATSDAHFVDPEDEIYRKILFAGQKYENIENSCTLFFPTTEDMLNEFSYFGAEAAREVVIVNPGKIADRIQEIIPIPKENAFPIMQGAEEKIKTMTIENALRIYGDPLPEIVQKRVDYELNCIIKNGFATLYLIAHELVKKSLNDGYLVGSRGSVGSSIVATFTNITEVNPLPPHYICKNEKCKYSEFFPDLPLSSGFDLPDKICPNCGQPLKKDGQKIPFEVFLGFEGDKTPDIDLNFSGEYQPIIHKQVEVIFGQNKVFRAGTISTIADKTAFGFVKGYLEERKTQKKPAEMKRLALGCSGVKRTTGQHPGGIMIIPSDRDVHEFTPINYPANDREGGTITTHFDYNAIDKKLLKLDLLGHEDPTTIRMLQDITNIDIYKIPFDDKKTMSIFSGLDALEITPEDINGITLGTLGIPEFGTQFVRGMLEETRPKTFGELVRISGLSHGTDVWLNNAQSYIKSGEAKLSEVISVRDDIINYLIEHKLPNKLSFDIMENVRKGKGLKPPMIEAMKANDVPQWYIDSCNKIKYMFPKAHAAAYVMMAFRISYFKVYYPLAFYATYFSTKGLDPFDAEVVLKGRENIINVMQGIIAKGHERTNKDDELYTVLEIVLEAIARKVKFYPVDIYESHSTRFIVKNNDGLLCPLKSIQGLGEVVANKIFEEAQKAPFISVEDFKDRTKASKSVIELLDSLGTLKALPKTDQLSFFE